MGLLQHECLISFNVILNSLLFAGSLQLFSLTFWRDRSLPKKEFVTIPVLLPGFPRKAVLAIRRCEIFTPFRWIDSSQTKYLIANLTKGVLYSRAYSFHETGELTGISFSGEMDRETAFHHRRCWLTVPYVLSYAALEKIGMKRNEMDPDASTAFDLFLRLICVLSVALKKIYMDGRKPTQMLDCSIVLL